MGDVYMINTSVRVSYKKARQNQLTVIDLLLLLIGKLKNYEYVKVIINFIAFQFTTNFATY